MPAPISPPPSSWIEVDANGNVITLRWPPLRPSVHHRFGIPLAIVLCSLNGTMFLFVSLIQLGQVAPPGANGWERGGAPLFSMLLAGVCAGFGIYWLRLAMKAPRPETVRLDAEGLQHSPGWPGLNLFPRSKPRQANRRPRDPEKYTFGGTTRFERSQIKAIVRRADRVILKPDSYCSGEFAIGVQLPPPDLDWLASFLTHWAGHGCSLSATSSSEADPPPTSNG